MKRKVLRIGTRKSKLALWQTYYIAKKIKSAAPFLEIEIVKITTKGDKFLNQPLFQIKGDKGLFTKEIEEEILKGNIDMAVHSLKDVPTQLPQGLVLSCYSERDIPYDVLISKTGKSLRELPKGAVIGTSSLRRRAQLLRKRSDLIIKDIRGNVDTRLKKLQEGLYDAIILAYSSLKRLNWENLITEVLKDFVPAVGQGVMAIETREDDTELIEFLRKFINNQKSEIEALAEREFLKTLQGGCHIPAGALARADLEKGVLKIKGFVAGVNGFPYFESIVEGSIKNPLALGRKLTENLLEMGAKEILK
jgi:hydroxymethylbilane synthase